MKILIICKTLSKNDGQGRYALGLIKELARENNLTILTSFPEYGEKIYGPNITIIKIPYLLSIKSISLILEYFFTVKKYFKKCELVHFFTDIPNYLIFSPLLFFNSRPFYITAHGTFSISYLRKGWRSFFLKIIFRKAKKIFCVSRFTRNQILKNINLNNLAVVNNGVDFEAFDNLYQKLKNKTVKSERKFIISVGAIKPRKGYEYSLRALAVIKNHYPFVKYFIIGDQDNKDYLDELKDIIAANNLQKNVEFFEKISDEKLAEFYLKADLLLFTPVNYDEVHFEGFGLVCREAGVFFLPVVASKDCGAEDAVDDGKNGFLVPQKDPEKIAAAVLNILDNPDLAGQLGENGRRLAEENSWANINKKMKYN